MQQGVYGSHGTETNSSRCFRTKTKAKRLKNRRVKVAFFNTSFFFPSYELFSFWVNESIGGTDDYDGCRFGFLEKEGGRLYKICYLQVAELIMQL